MKIHPASFPLIHTRAWPRAVALIFAMCAAVATTAAADPAGPRSIEETAATHSAIAEAISPSVVRVEYTLRYDGSDAPLSRGWNQRCPNCGTFHSDRIDPIVKEERPLERVGFAISPNQIVTAHLLVHPRFIETITVNHNGRRTGARVSGYAIEQRAVILDLDEPLPEIRPLEFGTETEDPLFSVAVMENAGRWTTSVQPFAGNILLRENGSVHLSAQAESVIVNAAGRVAGITMNEELPSDGSWRVSPEKWEQLNASSLETKLGDQANQAERLLPRVSLHFRSPREEPGGANQYSYMYSHGSDDQSATERETIGIVGPDGRLIVLSHLTPATTARLERIRVHLPDHDQPIEAHFEASLTDYGAFVARLDETPDAAIRLNEHPIESLQGRLLLATELEVRGEQVRVFHEPARIADMNKGRRGVIFPDLAGNSANTFLFDLDGALVAFPLQVRERTVGPESRWRTPTTVFTPVTILAEILNDLERNSDPANIPVDADQEGRLAWVGVDIQPLDAGLARDFQVATLTDNGDTGGLVSFVYAGSPGADAGIQAGDILLRLTVEGLPRPFPVKIDSDRDYNEPFPWEHLDQIPEEYYSYLPPPWTSFANSFNQFLTELGFDREVVIEAIRDGEPLQHRLPIVKGPAHYEAAPQHKSDDFGMTVRELTFETRRFFQKDDDSPGMIIARIETGSAASSGGLKPFELITHVNGEPVLTVQQFEEAAGSENELRLSVQRMHQGRIAVIRKLPQ